MKKISKKYLFLLCLTLVVNVNSSDFLKQFVKTESNKNLFIGVREEKKELLEKLKKEQEEPDKAFLEKVARQIDEVKTGILRVDYELKRNPDEELLIRQQSLLKESEQTLKDTQRAKEDDAAILNESIVQLSAFIEDPELESFKKKHKMHDRLYYTFEDLQRLHDTISDTERKFVQLSEQEKSIRIEKESRKRSLAVITEEYEKRQQEAQIVTDITTDENTSNNTNNYEKDLFKIEEQFYKYKKQLEEIRLKEINHKSLLVEFQLFTIKAQLDLLKKQLRTTKSAIHVSESDVLLAEEELTKDQRAYFTQKDLLRQQHEKITKLQKMQEKELNQLSKTLNITLGSDIDEWSKKPKQTADSYLSLVKTSALSTDILTLSREKDILDAQISFEDEKFNYKKIRTEEKKTYFKISTRGFLTEEDIAKEHFEYETKKKEAEEKLKLYQTKVNSVSNLLNQLKKVLDRIGVLRDDAIKQKNLIFKDKIREYSELIQDLERSDRGIKRQIDLLGKLTGIYSGIIAEITSTVRLIDFIISELQASTIWYRPAYAITLDGVKNVISDTNAFLIDLRIYLAQFKGKTFFRKVYDGLNNPLIALKFLIQLILSIIVLIALKRYENTIGRIFFVHRSQGLLGLLLFVLGTILLFLRSFYRSIFLWVIIWLSVSLIGDNYIYILFYLVSIPYLFYLSNRFIRFVMMMNTDHNYILLPQDFQRRFEFVLSTLLYVSIAIFFFRQAFMLSSVYLRSELPNILLAINFIILQISLIFLITKEQIVAIIPERSDFWQWVHEQINHYYYFILLFVIAIIVMSNPYVGFGRLVLYLLSGLVYMLFLIKILSILHDFVKRISSLLFFSYDDTVVRERFSYAKTCFGLVIIASFVVLGFIGFIATAKIWGWDVSFYDLQHWLVAPILLEDTTNPITIISVLKLIAYVFGGLGVAYALKEYVLARIFDLLLVESGVQHTVTSIIQYIVIIVAIFIGFQSVGLGSLIGNMFIALAFSIGLYIKEPISDFVSYFIILVQRPVKIGDYVQIDQETMGVVRKITPRSVILRRKNSTTIVVPNSYVVSKSIENWNYVRNFIAVNDILLFVYFKEDPTYVKEILHQAVEEHPKVLKNPRSIVRLNNFTDYGYEFMVRAFISSAYTLEMWDIGSDIRLLIAKTFKDNDIEFAIPMYKIDQYGLPYIKRNEPHEQEQSLVSPDKTMKE